LNVVGLCRHLCFFAHVGIDAQNPRTVRFSPAPHCSYVLARVNRAIMG
jgi:hypothetical protein